MENSPTGWNRIARTRAEQRHLDAIETARLFALLQMGEFDALTTSLESKYFYGFWRPVTALALAATDGNPATTSVAGWQVLAFPTPPVPDYPSGHSTAGGAAAAIMEAVMPGRGPAFATTSGSLAGVTRSFASVATPHARMPTRASSSVITSATRRTSDSPRVVRSVTSSPRRRYRRCTGRSDAAHGLTRVHDAVWAHTASWTAPFLSPSRGSWRHDRRSCVATDACYFLRMSTPRSAHRRVRRLHESGCFVMPNPWDVGSAIVLEKMGFSALATTSAGFAWTLGRRDHGVTTTKRSRTTAPSPRR
jgi:hypothetical protein